MWFLLADKSVPECFLFSLGQNRVIIRKRPKIHVTHLKHLKLFKLEKVWKKWIIKWSLKFAHQRPRCLRNRPTSVCRTLAVRRPRRASTAAAPTTALASVATRAPCATYATTDPCASATTDSSETPRADAKRVSHVDNKQLKNYWTNNYFPNDISMMKSFCRNSI